MRALRARVLRVAAAPFHVLVDGESGSGKELVARALHAAGPRRQRRLCTVNCAALTDELLEAELFGHARGAFTGAVRDRAGLFEEADGGTLFLDEVGELSLRAQAKLLRVIQDGEVRRVGESHARRVDVRLVAATNRVLAEEVEARAASAPTCATASRSCGSPSSRCASGRTTSRVLARAFWTDAAARTGTRAALHPATLAALARYHWPGNVRELQNVMRALAVNAPSRGLVTPAALPPSVAAAAPAAPTLSLARRGFEEQFVRAALARAGHRSTLAARELGVSRQGLRKLLVRLGIEGGGPRRPASAPRMLSCSSGAGHLPGAPSPVTARLPARPGDGFCGEGLAPRASIPHRCSPRKSSPSTPPRWRRPSPTPSGSRSWARCGAAAPWSASRAASTARWSPRWPSRRSGKERVLGIFMPERDSSDDALRLGRMLASHLGIEAVVEDIAPALRGLGCYDRQNDAIRQVFPHYGDDWKCKITLPSILESDRLNVFQLTVQAPDGSTETSRMPLAAYLQLVAATNYKQRVRKMTEYYHADRLNYAVAGTPNRLEYDQGFFVKQGDGAADFKPIAHLYKTQVYALAHASDLPEEIRRRPPTTDTYSMAQTQEEFYFALPYDRMDLCLYAYNHGVPAADVAPVVGLQPAQVERVFKDIESKRRTTRYLHLPPVLIEKVVEI